MRFFEKQSIDVIILEKDAFSYDIVYNEKSNIKNIINKNLKIFSGHRHSSEDKHKELYIDDNLIISTKKDHEDFFITFLHKTERGVEIYHESYFEIRNIRNYLDYEESSSYYSRQFGEKRDQSINLIFDFIQYYLNIVKFKSEKRIEARFIFENNFIFSNLIKGFPELLDGIDFKDNENALENFNKIPRERRVSLYKNIIKNLEDIYKNTENYLDKAEYETI